MAYFFRRFAGYASLILFLLFSMPSTHAASFEEIAPASFSLLKSWRVEPIELTDAKAYYEAYRPCSDYLFHALGWSWPTHKISTEMNLDMIRYHVKQHQAQKSFTYIVKQETSPNEIYGAIYINPVEREGRRHVPNFQADVFDAEVSFWFSQAAEDTAQAATLFDEIFLWLEQSWPFNHVLLTVHKNYKFANQQLETAGLKPFTEDGDTGEQFYRLQ